MLIKLSQMLSTQLLQEIPIHVPCRWILPKFEETSEESPAWKSSWRRMEIKVCCFHWNWNWAPLGFFDLITLNPWIPFLHLRTKLPMLTLTLQVDPRLPHCKFLDHLPHSLPLPHHPTCSHRWLAPWLVSFPFAPWQFSAPWHFLLLVFFCSKVSPFFWSNTLLSLLSRWTIGDVHIYWQFITSNKGFLQKIFSYFNHWCCPPQISKNNIFSKILNKGSFRISNQKVFPRHVRTTGSIRGTRRRGEGCQTLINLSIFF